MGGEKPVILLYNPINGHGHLDSWLTMLIKSFLGRGYGIRCITDDLDSFFPICAASGFDSHPRLEFWDVNKAKERKRAKEKRNWRNIARRELRRFLRKVEKTVFRLDDGGLLRPANILDDIISCTPPGSPGADFLFITYLDMYCHQPRFWKNFGETLSLPFGGIRFVPKIGSPGSGYKEAWFDAPGFRGQCFLAESACEKYGELFPEKAFVALPDVTNADLPSEEPGLVASMRDSARGRTVVFLGGSLGARKNLPLLAKCVEHLDPDEWFFTICGRSYASSYGVEDSRAFNFLRSRSEIMLYLDYLPDERDFNAVIAAADIIYAVYRNFPYSGNMVSKAAYFGKPIVVAEGGLMAERVKRYKLGLAVPETNDRECREALRKLRGWRPARDDCARYVDDFGERQMGDALEKFIAGCGFLRQT